MAAGSSVFNEVLEIRVDEQQFASDMDAILAIYAEKIKQMPQLGSLDTSQAVASLQNIDAKFSELSEGVGAVANQITEALDRIGVSTTTMSTRTSAALAEVAKARQILAAESDASAVVKAEPFASYDGRQVTRVMTDLNSVISREQELKELAEQVTFAVDAQLAAQAANAEKEAQTTTEFNGTLAYAAGRIGAFEAGLGRLNFVGGALARTFEPLGKLLIAAFPIIGAIALIDIISNVIDYFDQLYGKVRKSSLAWVDLAESLRNNADAAELNNLKLQDAIDKLEGHPSRNRLAEALLENKIKADELSKSISDAIEKASDLLTLKSVGFVDSLFSGVESTSDLKSKLEAPLLQLAEAHKELLIAQNDDEKKAADQQVAIARERVDKIVAEEKRGLGERKAAEIAAIGTITTTELVGQRGTPVRTQRAATPQESADQLDAINKKYSAKLDILNSIIISQQAINDLTDADNKGAGLRIKEASTEDVNKGAKQRLDGLKAEYESSLKGIKEFYDSQRTAVKEGEDAHTISVEEGSQRRTNLTNDELDKIAHLVQTFYEQKLPQAALKPDQAQKFTEQLRASFENIFKDSGRIIGGDGDAVAKEYARVQKLITDGDLQRSKDQAAAQLKLKQDELQQEYASQIQTVAAIKALKDKETTDEIARLQKLKDADPNSVDKQQFQNQIDLLKQKSRNTELEFYAVTLPNAKQADLKAEFDFLEKIAAFKVAQDRLALQRPGIGTGERASAQQQVNLDTSSELQRKATDALGKFLISLQEAGKGFNDANLPVALRDLKLAWLSAQQAADLAKLTASSAGSGPIADVINKSRDLFKPSTDNLTKFSDVVGVAASAAQAFGSVLNAVKQGYAQGGVLGGIGAGASQAGGFLQGLTGLAGIGKSIPIVGDILAGVGQVFSIVGDLFTAAAKRAAQKIEDSITNITNAFQNGAITLNQAIQQLEQQRQQAIATLSGQKGGQAQLDKLLPQLNQQIAQLQQQQKQIITNFQQSLTVLEQGGTVLAQWYQTWEGINKQVKDYLDAGGNKGLALQFLQLSLQQQQQKLQSDYNAGLDQAIQDAISLNSLHKQRLDLIKQEKDAEFAIISQDSVQRRQSLGVTIASQLNQQRQQYQQQLDQLDQQITLTTDKVNLEKQVFTISDDIAELHREDEKLQLAALQQQLDGYKQMAQLIQTAFNPNLFFGPKGGFLVGQIPGISAPPPAPLNITVQVNDSSGDPRTVGRTIADTLAQELQRRARFGGA